MDSRRFLSGISHPPMRGAGGMAENSAIARQPPALDWDSHATAPASAETTISTCSPVMCAYIGSVTARAA